MSRPTRLRLESLEARETPSANRFFALSQDGGNSVVVYEAVSGNSILGYPSQSFSTGQPMMLNGGAGRVLASFNPYAAPFAGGVRLALGDVTGDGIEDLVTAPASGGGPHIKVFDGSALLSGRAVMVREFAAFDPNFRGGTYLAVGQIDPSTVGQEIIVGAGLGGGAHVRVFGLTQTQPVRDFFAFDSGFRGGVRVAAADMDNDGRSEVIASMGPGGLPQVRVFDLKQASARKIDEFIAYDRTFTGGVYVAAGEVDSRNGFREIVTGAGEGGGPHVKVWSRENAASSLAVTHDFFAGGSASRAGVRVAVGNLGKLSDRQTIYVGDGDGPLRPSTGSNGADPRLRAYDLTKYITMVAAGYNGPTSFFYFTETHLSLTDPFVDGRSGGLNIG